MGQGLARSNGAGGAGRPAAVRGDGGASEWGAVLPTLLLT